MATEIEVDAYGVLENLIVARDEAERSGDVDQVSDYVPAQDLASATGLTPGRVTRAVEYLEARGLVDVIRTMGAAPFGFADVRVTTPGRQTYQLAEEGAREQPPAAERPRTAGDGRRVFVVHGKDESTREKLARTLQQLELEPVILAEQPNRGQTLIEKFEENAEGVVFAVAILTPDDWGRGPGDDSWPEVANRPRQNVVLELGYFMAALGRSRVAALVQDGTEQPSDIHGIVYIRLDPESTWRFELARELRAANVDVDLNLLV